MEFIYQNFLGMKIENMEHSLSQEEQEELARSNKKVKDVSHAGFSEGQYSGPSSPSHNVGP